METPSKDSGLSTLFYLGGVPFAVVNVLVIQVHKSCHLNYIKLETNREVIYELTN